MSCSADRCHGRSLHGSRGGTGTAASFLDPHSVQQCRIQRDFPAVDMFAGTLSAAVRDQWLRHGPHAPAGPAYAGSGRRANRRCRLHRRTFRAATVEWLHGLETCCGSDELSTSHGSPADRCRSDARRARFRLDGLRGFSQPQHGQSRTRDGMRGTCPGSPAVRGGHPGSSGRRGMRRCPSAAEPWCSSRRRACPRGRSRTAARTAKGMRSHLAGALAPLGRPGE